MPLPLDVTDPDQVAAAASVASDVTLLINNSGYAAFEGAIAATDMDDARREMEVNHFGTLAMLPAHCTSRCGALLRSGTLANIYVQAGRRDKSSEARTGDRKTLGSMSILAFVNQDDLDDLDDDPPMAFMPLVNKAQRSLATKVNDFNADDEYDRRKEDRIITIQFYKYCYCSRKAI